jgi:hypothetical protein
VWIYVGIFIIAFATLVVEITLTRLLSVITWYHLAFFAVATAMLGMTAGATRIYLRPDVFRKERVEEHAARACLDFALTVPLSVILLCLLPLGGRRDIMFLLALVLATFACALPFYFSGTALSLLLTKHWLPVGKMYASDLVGASLGCLFVLFGLEVFDAPSLLLVAGAMGGLAAALILRDPGSNRMRRRALIVFAVLALVGLINTTPHGIRPVFVKDQIEIYRNPIYEKWNSFSRVMVYRGEAGPPQLWGPSPLMPSGIKVLQYHMNIDGMAGTDLRRFRNLEDIDHLRYDITNIGYYLRPSGKVCVIGVGAGRDIQSAILFGHTDILGIELNPIFINLLRGMFRDGAGIASQPGVRLVVDEARSYLTRSNETFSLLQMSLIDTWAATGAGAYSLSENGLYTVEAWKVLLSRLSDDGIFMVSRWHYFRGLGETGRVVSLAVAALFEIGAKQPANHIVLVTSEKIATLLVRKTPLDDADIAQVQRACRDLGFRLAILPGQAITNSTLEEIVSAKSPEDLARITKTYPLNYEPPTDNSPYFFNMLRPNFRALISLATQNKTPGGVVGGNLIATATLAALVLALSILAAATIIIPLRLHSRIQGNLLASTGPLWAGGLYFSLIGAGFMLLEIALIQRLSVYLGHPIYALGILLFTLIASTGVGSYLSERLPLTRRPWMSVCSVAVAAIILALNLTLGKALASTVAVSTLKKIFVSIAVIAPVGVILGFFFPTGIRLFRGVSEEHLPWFWGLNGVFGVLCSALAVFISIFFGISTNFYVAACCYLGISLALLILYRSAPAAGTECKGQSPATGNSPSAD